MNLIHMNDLAGSCLKCQGRRVLVQGRIFCPKCRRDAQAGCRDALAFRRLPEPINPKAIT